MTKPASSETIGDNQSGKQPAKKKRGRPARDYDPKVADRILEQIIAGKSLRRICAAKHMPGTTTVMKWLRETPEFQQRYARAREEQAEGYADELVDLARKATADNAHAIRVRADIIKWVCSKLKPQRYGDRLGVDMQADVAVHAKHAWEDKPREQWSELDVVEFRKHHLFAVSLLIRRIREELGQAETNEVILALARHFAEPVSAPIATLPAPTGQGDSPASVGKSAPPGEGMKPDTERGAIDGDWEVIE